MSLGKNYENEQLDKIKKFEQALTPMGRYKLRGKLREARALAKLLAVPIEDRTPKEKDDIDTYYSKLSNSVRISQLGMKPTHENMKVLGDDYHQQAKLVEATKVYSDHRYGGLSHEEAEKLTNEYLNKQGEGHADTSKWSLDGDLTNKYGGEDNNYRGAVFKNESGEVFAPFRGTKFGLSEFGAEDLALDAEIVTGGKVPNHPQMSQADDMIKATIDKYGRGKVKTGGYSLGGFKGIHAGNMNRIDSVTFNPLTQGTALLDDSSHPMSVNHKIIRTPDDFPSLNSGSLKGKYPNRYDISSVGAHANVKYGEGYKLPFTDYDTGFSLSNIKQYGEHAHKQVNFVEDHLPRVDEHTAYFRHLERGINTKTNHHHLDRYKNMIEHNELSNESSILPAEIKPPKLEPNNSLRIERLKARGYSVNAPTLIETGRKKRIRIVDEKKLSTMTQKRQNRFNDQVSKRQELQTELDELNKKYNPENFNIDDWNNTVKERLAASVKTTNESTAKGQIGFVNRELNRQKTLKSMLNTPGPKLDDRPFTEPQIDKYINEQTVKFKLPPTSKDVKPEEFGKGGLFPETPGGPDRPWLNQGNNLPFNRRPETKLNFTDYSNKNNIGGTDKNKFLWEKSGGKLTDSEKEGYDKDIGKDDIGIDDKELNDFKDLGTKERENHLGNMENESRGDFNVLEQAQKATGRTSEGIFTDGLATGFKRLGLSTAKGVASLGAEGAKGLGFGLAGNSLRKYGEYSSGVKLNKPEANIVDATLSAGMYSRYLGGSLVKGGIAGGLSTAIGMGTEYGTTKGLEALGVSENTSKGVGATTGGIASGASFVGLSSALGADALLGAEAGSELGPLGILAGGVVGGLIGLGSYFASK